MTTLPPEILAYFRPFSVLFRTQKTFSKMLLLFLGATLCNGGRTVCGCLRALGMHGEKAFSNYHRVLNKSKWDSFKGAKLLLNQLLPLTNFQLTIIVDEHLERRNGKKIKAKAIYRDAVASSASWLVKCWGVKWVVFSCLIYFPWSLRAFALPFFCVPILPESHPIHKKRKYRTGIDLTCQMLMAVRRWLPGVPITLVGDGDYGRVKLAQVCTKLDITLITLLRADARLHEIPPEYKGKRRRKMRGKRLRKEDIQPSNEKVAWYGGKIKEVSMRVKHCIWYAGKPEVYIPVFAGWFQVRENDEFILAVMGAPFKGSAKEMLELYLKRWNLEVTFRECREHLGVETQRQWSDLGIARSTPLLFSMYSWVTILGDFYWRKNNIKPLKTAWYNKKYLTFSDLFETVKKELWKHRSDSGGEGESEKITPFEENLSEVFFKNIN